MTFDLTIAIPLGAAHMELAPRAIDSVKRQTVRVLWGVWEDKEARGAGWARNRLLEKVTTPFVAFLDADDYLEPNYAESMLAAAKAQPTRYIYCGWKTDEDAQVYSAPLRCYCFDNDCLVHPITALLPTAWAKAVGGFDEKLPGMEDTDFFLKLTGAGHCGARLDLPLLHWTPASETSRSWQFKQRADYTEIKRALAQKYYRRDSVGTCCGGQGRKNEGPFGERQPGDVLAHMEGPPLLGGYVGWHTARIYKSPGYGSLVWADPNDVRRDARTFRLAEQPAPPQEPVPIGSGWTAVATPQNAPSAPPPFRPPAQVRPEPQPPGAAGAPPSEPEGDPLPGAPAVADFLVNYVRDGADVYLPQNDAPKTNGRVSVDEIRRLAGFE